MRTDGYNGKADLYRPKSSVNMMSSTDSDLPLACGSACSRDPELVFQMPVFNPRRLKDGEGWQTLLFSDLAALPASGEGKHRDFLVRSTCKGTVVCCVQVKWDYEAFNPLIPPKTKTWPDQARFLRSLLCQRLSHVD